MCLGLPCVWGDIELGPLPGVQEMMSLVTRLLGLLYSTPHRLDGLRHRWKGRVRRG